MNPPQVRERKVTSERLLATAGASEGCSCYNSPSPTGVVGKGLIVSPSYRNEYVLLGSEVTSPNCTAILTPPFQGMFTLSMFKIL